MNEWLTVTTSSPGRTPAASSAKCSAVVQLETAHACGAPPPRRTPARKPPPRDLASPSQTRWRAAPPRPLPPRASGARSESPVVALRSRRRTPGGRCRRRQRRRFPVVDDLLFQELLRRLGLGA